MANYPDVLTYERIFDYDPGDSIQLKNSLASSVQMSLTIEYLIKKIKMIPNFETLRNDPELLLFIANILKEIESNDRIKGNFKSLEIDKKQLIISAYTKVFNLNGTEISTLTKQYEFLEKHNKIVGIKYHKKVFKWLSDVFFYLVKRLL